MSYSIAKKVALVTGANKGIGKAIVESFIGHGVKKVYLAVRNTETTKDLEEKYGNKVVTIQADVTKPDDITAMAKEASDVEILVSNAGIYLPDMPFEKNADELLKNQLDVNVYGFLRLTTAFARILEDNKGALIQLNSVASLKGFSKGFFTYSATKAASYSLTQSLREHFAPKGVQVFSIHPGPIDTDMGAQAGFEGAASPSTVSDAIVAALETGEFHVFPDETAKQIGAAYEGFATNVVEAEMEE